MRVIAICTVWLPFSGNSDGATIDAKSAALRDVESAIRSAREGDTVAVPAGTVTWASGLAITKGITLQGATHIDGAGTSKPVLIDDTVIIDRVPGESNPPLPATGQASPEKQQRLFGGMFDSGAKQNLAGLGKSWVHQPLIAVTLTSAQSFRLSGFTFRYEPAARVIDSAAVHIQGTCPSVRVDHCHFDQLYRNPFIMTHGQIYGVVDHCVLDERQRALTFQIYHDGWEGQMHGDGSWTDGPNFGTEKFLFIEDNTFRNANGYLSVGIDGNAGARYVARHNYLVDTPIGGHGTESTGRARGVRAIEVYDNTCVWNLVEPRGQLRSGTMIEFNNLWTGNKAPRRSTTLTCYREFRPFSFWGGASGNNRLDSNDPHGLYASGKHTGENGSTILVVANAGWASNQWAGYSVTNTSQTLKGKAVSVFHPSSYIESNTSDTINFARDDSFNGPNLTFNTGDGFAIYKASVALDQPGRGKGDLLADKDPAATGSWPHQASEPAYAWGNTYNNSQQVTLGSPYPTIKENRDFYNQQTAFDGTSGIGVGKLADRPKTCRPGVAYWATDAGLQGTLYQCAAPDEWSPYYMPYSYPHPLVSGSPATRTGRHEEKGGE